MSHPIAPPKVGSLEELGTEIARLRYDAQIVLFQAYKIEMEKQATTDATRGRLKLSRFGYLLGEAMQAVLDALRQMLRRSIPFMKKEFEEVPLLTEV